MKIDRLKDKLGTKQLPTAEIELCGSTAYLLSEPGRGVAMIAYLINITRLYNSVSAISGVARMLSLARDYANKRIVFGAKLSDQPLHLDTLAALDIEHRAGTALVFDALALLGRVEISKQTPELEEDAALLRFLTPLAKLYTAKQSFASMSEFLEDFGGAGYVEDTDLPRALRDAQVLTIWEGTTNVLSMDVLRVLSHDNAKAFTVYQKVVNKRLDLAEKNGKHSSVSATVKNVRNGLNIITSYLQKTLKAGSDNEITQKMNARHLAYAFSRIYMTSSLIEHALWTGAEIDWVVPSRWNQTVPLIPHQLLQGVTSNLKDSRFLALGPLRAHL